MRKRIWRPNKNRQRGQALVEFAIIAPVLALMVSGVIEFGLAFNADMALEAASREGARVGAALGNDGTQGICPDATAEATVDPAIVNAVQASLTNAGVDLSTVGIAIFRADDSGNATSDKNTFAWVAGSPVGHFTKTSGSWNACGRHDGTFGGGVYDSVGVSVSYIYYSTTGLLSIFSGGLPMTATAVFPIGPPWRLL